MTPPALDPGVVLSKLRLMQDLLDDLDAVPPPTASTLREDRMLRHALERILTQLVELAAGINAHVAAARLGGGAATYHESFALAARAGVLTPELAERLAPSAGLRNILVHEYLVVDLDQVVQGAALAKEGYRAYVRAVADFLAG